MRISTFQLHRQGVDNMLRQQEVLARTQNELANGKKMQTAASNPTGWATAASLDRALAQIDVYQANAGTAQNRLGHEDNMLAAASDILTRARELAIQVNGPAMDSASRSLIATQLEALRQELLDVANAQDADGRYLFAGSASASAPFSLSSGGAVYSGDQSVRQLQISAHRSVADSDAGSEVFLRLRDGNGTFDVTAAGANGGSAFLSTASVQDLSQWDGDSYTVSFNAGSYEVRDSASALVASGAYQSGAAISFSGVQVTFEGTPANGDQFNVTPSAQQDVFATLQKLIDFAEAPAATAAQRAQAQTLYSSALQELDTAATHFSDLRGSVGARLNAVEETSSALAGNTQLAQEQLSSLRDLDYAEAASRLSLQQTLLQAAQLSYQRVQGLSLFDYLR